MDYYGEDSSYYHLTNDEKEFLRMLKETTWRMARTVADQAPEHGERFIDYLREELRLARREKRPAGLVKNKK